jgi:hypothetical protein
MSIFRLAFFLACGAVLLAAATLLSRQFFYIETFFPSHLEFFLIAFIALFGLMIVCLILAVGIEKAFSVSHFWAHFFCGITLTILCLIQRFWEIRYTMAHPAIWDWLMFSIFFFFICATVSFTTLASRHFCNRTNAYTNIS